MLRTRFVGIRIKGTSISLSGDIYVGQGTSVSAIISLSSPSIYIRARLKCVTERDAVGFTRAADTSMARGVPRPSDDCAAIAFPRRMWERVYLRVFVLGCMCIRRVSVKPPAHSVRACVHGCKYMYDGLMRSARIVRAPAPWIIQWDDLPILGKRTGPMVTAKGGATTT